MYPQTAYPLRTTEISDVVVPRGDPGEQLIANVILSVVACHLHSNAAAKPFILQAHALALELADRSPTYRPAHPSRFARVVCQIDGETESILYSVIDNILVVPMITPGSVVQGQSIQPAAILRLEMARYKLRLRTQKIAALLEPLTKGVSADRLSDVAQHVLTQTLRRELPPVEPLVRASENFTLAHNLIGRKNYPLAILALDGAANALELYANNTPLKDHAPIVQSMRRQITLMSSQIRHRAM
jgi:hypothetical protein